MKLLLVLCILISCSSGKLFGDVSQDPLPGSLRFVLHNDTLLLQLFIHKDGIIWDPDHLQVNADKGLQADPVNGAVLWNENGVLTRACLTNKTTSKIWVPEKIGQIFHYDWHNKWLYWYPEDDIPKKHLQISDLNHRYVYGVETIESGALEAIDSENELFIYKTDDSLKMYEMDSFEEKYSIQIDNNFEVMDIIATDRVLVLLQSKHNNDKQDGKRDIKLYSYDGEQLLSVPGDVEYDSIFFQKPLLVMKHKYEITVLDIESKDVLFKVEKKQFGNMTLKHLRGINMMEVPAQSTYSLISECEETDYQEVCVLEEDAHCVYQSYIISNGTSFKYYNPASESPPFPLPFQINGSIRNFDTYKKERIFWIDDQSNSIMMNYIYLDTESEKLDYSTVHPTDLKVDEKQRLVFWSDMGKRTIEVSDFDGLVHKVLFTDVHMPRKILLLLDQGLILWIAGDYSDMIVSGSIEEGLKTIIYKSEQPIFGFTFNNINNKLYVGSQDTQLYIHNVDLKTGKSVLLVNYEETTKFFDVLYGRSKVYYLGAGTFWKIHPYYHRLHAVSKGAFNSSFLSPILCDNTKSIHQSCEMCNGLCLSNAQGTKTYGKNSTCIPLNTTTKGVTYCDSKKYLFAATRHAVYRLTDNIHCSTRLYSPDEDLITAKQPVAYEPTWKNVYIAVNNYIYHMNLNRLSWSVKKNFNENITEVVYTGFDEDPILRFTSSLHGNRWESWDGATLSNPLLDAHFIGYKKYNQYSIPLPVNSASVIAYPSQNAFFYIENNSIYLHGKTTLRQIALIPSHIQAIRLSYEENRIYYWDGNTLHSMRLDGEKHRQSVFEVPAIKTFAFMNKVMYFISEEDGLLYELDYNSKSNTVPIKLVENQPKGVINLINFPPANNKAIEGCEQLKDDDGELFNLF